MIFGISLIRSTNLWINDGPSLFTFNFSYAFHELKNFLSYPTAARVYDWLAKKLATTDEEQYPDLTGALNDERILARFLGDIQGKEWLDMRDCKTQRQYRAQ